MELPTSLYVLVGALIIGNLGTIFTVLFSAGRAIWWVSKLDARVQENSKDIQASFEKHRQTEQRLAVVEDDVRELKDA